MKVENKIHLGNDHYIEFGRSSWNEEELSVRNRYPTANGGFSPHSSSEMPIRDVLQLALQVLESGLFDVDETILLGQAALESLRRISRNPT